VAGYKNHQDIMPSSEETLIWFGFREKETQFGKESWDSGNIHTKITDSHFFFYTLHP